MKRILKITAFAIIMVLGSSLRNTVSAQYDEDRDVSYQTFYDELSPHGRWIDYPGQGYVWVPDAGPDFRPYSTNGHWVWSDDYEWVWVSDYDWGWAPFHYGRWDNDPSYGWYWVPGYEWSPAWVAWRDGGDYYGWAPIRPGISISLNFNIGGYSPPVDFWCFAPRRYITSPRIYDYYLDRRQNVTIINYTTIITNNYHYGNNYGFRSGPRRYDAERYCGVINPVRFRQTFSPGRSQFRNNELSIYRPNVRRDNNQNFAPRRFDRYDRNNATANNGPGRNDNGFRRNDNNNTVNSNTDRRINRPDRTPDTRNSNGSIDNNRFERRNNNDGNNDTRRFERKDDNVRQPQNNNGNNSTSPDRRRFERTDNNADRPNRDIERRVITPTERPDRTPDTRNNNGNNDSRRFERRNTNDGNTNTPVRQPEVRRNENNFPQPQQQQRNFERRQETRQQPQQMERRQQPQPQVERRQEPRQQQPSQPRQFERKDNGNQQQNSNSDNGNRNSRKRF